MAKGLKAAKKAIGTADAALASGDVDTARRALAFAGSVVGLGGVPKVDGVEVALSLVCAAYSAKLDRVNAERALFGRGPILGLAL